MRLLIIEDEKQISRFLKKMLTPEFSTIDVAEDGMTGSALALQKAYDVIILDNLLPKMTGLEVCEQVRKSGKTTPIIALSVQNETADKVKLLNAGADDYLSKPFLFEELLARLRALVRRPHKPAGETLLVDNLSLDKKTYSVKRDGVQMYLTRKEFEMLEYLIRNRGTVVSRAMIMENIWNVQRDPLSQTVAAHIANIRKKINLPGMKRLIHTVPGRGYKIEAA